jgi:hypothetical protein
MKAKMIKLINDNGLLSKEADQLLLEFRAALSNIMLSDEVLDMNEQQLRTFGCSLSKLVGDAVSNKANQKVINSSKFSEMTDEEFETYLQNKYGDRWSVMTLTPEEVSRVPVITQEQIKKILEESSASYSYQPPPGLIFPFYPKPRYR